MYKSILFITLSLRTGSSTFSPGRPGGQHQQLQLVLYLGSDWLTATPISRLPLVELQGPVQRVGLTLNLRKNISTSSVHVLRSSRTRIFEGDTGGNTNIASVVLFLGTDLAISYFTNRVRPHRGKCTVRMYFTGNSVFTHRPKRWRNAQRAFVCAVVNSEQDFVMRSYK